MDDDQDGEANNYWGDGDDYDHDYYNEEDDKDRVVVSVLVVDCLEQW